MQPCDIGEIDTASIFITDPDSDRRLEVFASRLRTLHAAASARYCRPDQVPGVGTSTVYKALRGVCLPTTTKLRQMVETWGGSWQEFAHMRHWVQAGVEADLNYFNTEGPYWNSDAARWEPCPWDHQVPEQGPLTHEIPLAPPHRRTAWNSDSIDKDDVTQSMAAEYEAGASIRTLVRAYGFPYTTIRNALLRAGVTLRPPK